MIIGSSTVQMGSARNFKTKESQRTTAWLGSSAQKSASSVVTSSQYTTTQVGDRKNNNYFMDTLKGRAKDEVTAQMEQSMLGKNSRISSGSITSLEDRASLKAIREQSLLYLLRYLHQIMGRNRGNWGMQGMNGYNNGGNSVQIGSIQNEYYYQEQESTYFETKGKVVTADGREIEFNLGLEMSRSFSEYYYESVDFYAQTSSNSLIDPLVINLNSNIASVTDQKFMFDIDGDGILDSISQLNSGSGFLALDLNGDGIINDGSELFGTKSGDGFADLARYDSDGNGWIDENDEIFSKLLIWTKDENGNDKLYTLKEAGVGAICLQSVETDFSLKSLKDNALNGQIRRTGAFLYENGNVGTIQHLDVAR